MTVFLLVNVFFVDFSVVCNWSTGFSDFDWRLALLVVALDDGEWKLLEASSFPKRRLAMSVDGGARCT